ncbi:MULTISPECIES: hypothetical protein [unclassified Arsukibacterium]|uniref:hypothetical protein n=1 Tax=unclassified Arsukibacterium TaxID=2635278 RepID=UPI0025C40DEC|nr:MULTISPECIES: hypothetical protein [unclassified Arsukibacterium]|tara:strand:- start:85853 stop:87577 length:1725 start_codon:yes stop_codon:yes gene_type:complete
MSLDKVKEGLLVASDTNAGLLAVIKDFYIQEIRSKDNVLKNALSELHNEGKIDLIKIVLGIDIDSSRHIFTVILQVFESALPSLNASVEDVLNCLVHLTQQAGRDVSISDGTFGSFLRMEPQRPKESIELILNQKELDTYALYLSCSILAYNSENVTEAIQTINTLIADRNATVRNQAYFSLGWLPVNGTHVAVIWDLLSRSANSENENSCCASILKATLKFAETFPSYWSQTEELLLKCIEKGSLEVLYTISDVLAFQRIQLPANISHFLINKIANVSPENKGIIDNIDYLLVNLVKGDSQSVAIELLESLLTVGVKLESLDFFSNELLREYPELLNHIVTKWFLSGKSSFCHAASNLLHDVAVEDVELKADIGLLADEEEQLFVSHKAVGWLFMRPIAAASFILSIYETTSINTQMELEAVLYDPLLLSYPGDLKLFFQSCINSGFQVNPCKQLLDKLQKYHDDLEKVSGVKELMAPRENVRAYWKEFSKSMQDANEEASKSSIFQLITTTKRLLYGNSSIYYMNQGGGEQIRQEMQMQNISHSTEMPMLNVLEPELLDYRLRVYRYRGMAK